MLQSTSNYHGVYGIHVNISLNRIKHQMQIIFLEIKVALFLKEICFWHNCMNGMKPNILDFASPRDSYALCLDPSPSQSKSCCVHPHSIEIDWKGLKGDSGSCDLRNATYMTLQVFINSSWAIYRYILLSFSKVISQITKMIDQSCNRLLIF